MQNVKLGEVIEKEEKKLKKEKKTIQISWIQSKIYNISTLFMIFVIIIVAIVYIESKYQFIDRNQIVVISQAHASYIEKKEIEEEKKPIEIIDCETAVKVYSKQYGVNEGSMMDIMKAESGNNNLAENKESTATGCFQFVIGSWRSYGKKLWGNDFYGKNIYNPKDNTELASWVVSQYGTSAWDASKSKWAK